MTSTTATDCPIAELLRRVRADFLEMPGLHVTRAQAQRLWAMDGETCDQVLLALVQSRFLRPSTTRSAAFLRA